MQLLPLSLSVGILAGLWTYISAVTGILTWPTFAGWSVFFFAGANNEGIKQAVPPAIVGMLLGYLSVVLTGALGGSSIALSILVVIIAFIMTYLMNVPTFALAPSAFLGAAVYFGVGDLIAAAIPFFIGLVVLGPITMAFSDLLEKWLGSA